MRDDATFWHADKETCILKAKQAYIDEGRQATTIRHYYYKLLSSDALRVYPNVETSKKNAYAWVSELLTDARNEGSFPWEAVVDNGRRGRTFHWYNDLAYYAYIETASAYSLDVWYGQPRRVEIISEKDGLLDMIAGYVERWRIPVRSLDGFNSTTKNKMLAERYGTGKNYVLLCVGDFDPSGILIPTILKERLNQYGSYPDIRRIVLTEDDIKQLPAHAAVEISPKNPHAKEFKRRYPGMKGYEVEALPASELKRKIISSVAPYLDLDAFQDAIDLEMSIRSEVEKRLMKTMKGYVRETLSQKVAGDNSDLRYLLLSRQYVKFKESGRCTYTNYETDEEVELGEEEEDNDEEEDENE